MAEPASPAAIVKTTGVDDVLEKVEAALDAQDFRNEFLEGKPLTQDDIRRREALLTEIARECNIRLEGRVRIVGAWPELQGFGAQFRGLDSDGREYTIEYHVGAEARMAHDRDDRERDVRETVDLIVTEVLRQRAVYLHRMNGSTGTA